MQKMAIPVTPLTDEQVQKTLSDMEDVMRYRLRMSEVIPVEMSRYQIGRCAVVQDVLCGLLSNSGRTGALLCPRAFQRVRMSGGCD